MSRNRLNPSPEPADHFGMSAVVTPAGGTAAAAITPQMLADVVLGKRSAAVVQDALGVVYTVPQLDRWQRESVDVVVLLTRDEALGYLADAAAVATSTLTAAGALL